MSVRHTITRLDPERTYTVYYRGAVLLSRARPSAHGILQFDAPGYSGIRVSPESETSSIEDPPVTPPPPPPPTTAPKWRVRLWLLRLLRWLRGRA